jgi:hypothetical protein
MGGIGVTTSALATAAEVDLVPANNRAGAFIDVTAAVTFTVLNLSDSGPGSLRQAIVNANGNGNAAVADVIVFNIPGAGPFTIPLATPLPTITEPVNIDGTTQPGFGGSTRVHLSGGGIAGAGLFVGLTGGPSAIRGLSITGFSSQGIRLVGSGNVVVSNLIGLTPLGAAVPNGEGVFVDAGLNNTIGGPNASNRNVISGNNGHGVMITGGFDATGNAVLGNYIGTNIAGTAAVANGGAGVVVTARASAVGGPTAGMGNVIAGNGQNGITISADDSETTVQGNFIGTDASGTAAIPNAGNGIAISDTEFSVIGGTDPAARNIISGNGGNGISLTNDASATTIQGNHIGMNAAGTAAIPNLGNGVRINGTFSTLLGGSTPAARNLISANAGNGVVLDDSRNNDIVGNFIGTDVTGLVDFGNGGHGVAVINDSDSNRIGGSGGANLISENGFDGVSIDASSQRVEIGENSIHSNGGLGIDQNDDGPTIGDPQDLDVGSNDLQNYPDLASALSFGQIAGNLHSAVSSAFVVRFYSSPTCDATTQGETFRGSATINTDSAGNGAIVVFVGALTPGHGVTATATDAAGNTSEFSPCVVVSSPNEPAAGPVASAGLLGSGRQAPPGVRRDRIAGR